MKCYGKTNPLIVLISLCVFLAGAGAAYYFTRSDAEKKTIDDTAQRATLMAEVQITKKRIAVYKAFVKACDDAKNGVSSDPPKYEGYDAFSYKDEGKYRTELGAQESRLSDLQSRLGSAYDK